MEAELFGEITDSRGRTGSMQEESEYCVMLQHKEVFKTKKMRTCLKEMRQTERAPNDQTWNRLSK